MLTRRRFLAASAVGALSLVGCTTADHPQVVCSTFPVGPGSYNDLAALAGPLTATTGRRIRLVTSGTSIGRLAPLINGTAQYARVGDEYLHAFEGEGEFAAAGWGPQPVRQVWSPPGFYGVCVRVDSGITTTADLRGARVPDLVGSTSMNRKLEAALAHGGLTRRDVREVRTTYADQLEALRSGQLDVAFHNVVGASIEEFAARHAIRWLDLGGGDAGVEKRWREIVPMVAPGIAAAGAGITAGEPVTVMTYTVPVVTLAHRPVEEVAALVGDIHRLYPRYRDATPDAHRFDVAQLLTTPLVVPFHPGSVEVLRAHGRWSPALDAHQAALLERETALRAGWDAFRAHSPADPAAWQNFKSRHIPARPHLEDL